MSAWNCCRTCLGTATLSPIFPQTEYSEHYTNVIFIATGVKVELNDELPQQICHPCITFINETMKFRKKCEHSQITLKSRLTNTQEIKLEYNKTELAIDISEYIDDDFKDYDDNISLNTLQYTEPENLDTKNCDIKLDTKDTEMKEVDMNTKDVENEKKQDVKKEIFDKVKKERVVRKRSKKKEVNGEKAKEEIECEYCHKILTSKLSIRNHYKIHTGFDVVCEHCGKKFITRRLLLMHCRAKHGYEKTDKCSYCDYRASNAEQVKIHERLHTGEKPYVCAQCGAGFHRKSSYLQHVAIHLPEKTVQIHERLHTGEKPYVCAQCGAGFHRKSSYLQHVAIHLPEKTVQCTVCPARFKSVTLMRIHAARHRAPRYSFQCALCENSFARRRNVARHVQRIHGTPPEPHTICRRKIA